MIQAHAFIDIWTLSVALYKNRAIFETADTVSLNGLLKGNEWSAAKAAAGKALKFLTPKDGKRPSMTNLSVQRLMPGAHLPWDQFESDNLQFHLPIITNPLALTYSGAMSGHLPPGQLTYIRTDTLHSHINLGAQPRFHLVLEIKNPSEEVEIKEAT